MVYKAHKGDEIEWENFLEKLNCFMTKYVYVPRNSNKIATNKTYGNLHLGLGPVHTYFLRFQKKKIRVLLTGSVFRNRFRLSLRNRQSMKYDSIPYGACVVLVVNDAWHHCIRKHPSVTVFLSVRTEKPAFSENFTLE